MKLTFYGAAGEVTGSCYLVETDRARVLIDFGMHQGAADADARNRRPPPLNAPGLNAVILTHAHLDHAGRLPMLEAAGYTGAIHATPATIALAAVLLRDSAKIQEEDAAEAARHGRAGERPLYTYADVDGLMRRFRPLPYRTPREIAPGVTASLHDAGHILGSASVALTIREGGDERTIVFSGDIGPRNAPLLEDPDPPERADTLVLESTYGDRDHRPWDKTIEEFAGVLNEAARGRGKVLIPAFAVGRTQAILYIMGQLRREGRLPRVPVFLDSPMAIETTALYREHRDLFDDETWAIITAGDTPLRFEGLRITRTVEESKRIDDVDSAIVIAASGMMSGGRIVHHLRHHLGNPNTHLVVVGYQAQGTLGRRIVDGEKRVEIMGRPVVVKAKVHTIGGFSAHAGQSGLLGWAESIKQRPNRVFLTHGEDGPRQALRGKLKERTGIEAELPVWGQIVEL